MFVFDQIPVSYAQDLELAALCNWLLLEEVAPEMDVLVEWDTEGLNVVADEELVCISGKAIAVGSCVQMYWLPDRQWYCGVVKDIECSDASVKKSVRKAKTTGETESEDSEDDVPITQ